MLYYCHYCYFYGDKEVGDDDDDDQINIIIISNRPKEKNYL